MTNVLPPQSRSTHSTNLLALAASACLLATSPEAQARVTRYVIDDVKPLAALAGQTVDYEQLSGRVFGELDPRDPRNALIQDIELGKDADARCATSPALCSPSR